MSFPQSLLIAQEAGQTSPEGRQARHDTLSTKTGTPSGTAGAPAGSDSLATRPDSLMLFWFPAHPGLADRAQDTTSSLGSSDLYWLAHRYLGDILATVPGVFIRDQSSEGQYSQPNIRGTDWRGIGITMNGRPLNDPASGVYNIYYLSTDYVDRLEAVTGPRAFLYGLNSAGGALNVVTKNFHSNRPYTKINYSESGYEYQYSDATYSQNIIRRLNLSFGFQYQGTAGRFANSLHEAWNMRLKLRYALLENLTVVASEYFTNTSTGLNGGADVVKSPPPNAYDPFLVTVKNTDSYEKDTRHDVDVSLFGNFLGDSANVTQLTLYYSNNFRQYRDEENRPNPNGIFIQADHTSSWMGALLTQNFFTTGQRFGLGSSLELRQIEGSPNLGRRRNVIGAAWAKEEIPIGTTVTVAGYGRYDRYLHEDYAGVGGDVRLRIAEGIHLFGGTSLSHRLPSYAELYWTDSTVVRTGPIVAEKHVHTEVGAEAQFAGPSEIRLAFFHKRVTDPILYTPQFGSGPFPAFMVGNGGSLTNYGAELRLGVRVWVLLAEGTATWIVQKDDDGSRNEVYPEFAGTGGLYYRQLLFSGALDLKAGFRGSFLSSSRGEVYNPQSIAYVRNDGRQMGAGARVDFDLIAHIGTAYFHFLWENLTNAQYFTAPYYPVRDRMIRLAIEWPFLD
jgi:outer membrane cobalamin receptor